MSLQVEIETGQCQIILLALFKLKRERPGWGQTISVIEEMLGGQLDWPDDYAPYICLECGAADHVIADCPNAKR